MNVYLIRQDSTVHAIITGASKAPSRRAPYHHTVCAKRIDPTWQRIDASVPITCDRCLRSVVGLGDLGNA